MSVPRPADDSVRTVHFRMLILAAVVLAARLAVVQHPIPWHGDDERFAAGVTYLAGTKAGPAYPVHPPGYPLWVGLGALAHGLGLGAYPALIVWCVAASVVEPLVFYRLAARMTRDALAWWTALAYGLSPLYWFESVQALNYVPGSLIATFIVWCAWSAFSRAPSQYTSDRVASDSASRPLLFAAALLVIGMGVRQDLLLWLAPLVIWVAARTRWRSAFLIAGSLALGFVVWSLITHRLYAAGGAAEARWAHTWDKVLNTSVFRLGLVDGAGRNALKLLAYLAWTLGAAGLLLLAVLPPAVHVLRRQPRATWFFALWLLPALLFNIAIHMTEAGHAIWHLPVLYLLTALGAARILGSWAWRGLAAVAVAGVIQFWFYPWNVESRGWKRLLDGTTTYMSRAGLREIDRLRELHRPGEFWPTQAHKTPD